MCVRSDPVEGDESDHEHKTWTEMRAGDFSRVISWLCLITSDYYQRFNYYIYFIIILFLFIYFKFCVLHFI